MVKRATKQMLGGGGYHTLSHFKLQRASLKSANLISSYSVCATHNGRSFDLSVSDSR